LLPDELRQHDCLIFSDRPRAVDWHFKSAGTRRSARITGRLRANALDVLAAAAIDGAGIVRAPSWQVADDIEHGRLQRILQDYEPMHAPVIWFRQPHNWVSPAVCFFWSLWGTGLTGGN
jgi:DNA-binding transcriptional LysR family regulator